MGVGSIFAVRELEWRILTFFKCFCYDNKMSINAMNNAKNTRNAEKEETKMRNVKQENGMEK